ncbi:MAG: hypothetical protein E6589_17755 [Clostridium sp.]|nr:hypothetical protein [Clostridium sp.]MDU6274136.1 hypothetical protein [Clostridium sp.]MDU6329516.1 hypothetical protein [Clostridium sp.]
MIKSNLFRYDIKPTGTVTELGVVVVEGGRFGKMNVIVERIYLFF